MPDTPREHRYNVTCTNCPHWARLVRPAVVHDAIRQHEADSHPAIGWRHVPAWEQTQ